jgi:hypothetical protein
MSPSPKLTGEEKQNGKRKLLIPSKEISREDAADYAGRFCAKLVKRAIPPSPQSDPAKT